MPCLLLSFVLLASFGCTKSESKTAKTTIAASWKSPELPSEPFEKIFVIGVERNNEYRELYEDALVAALQQRGVVALASYDLLPQSDELTEEQIRSAIGTNEFDAVVITSLLHVDQSKEFVPPTTEKRPTGQFPQPVHFYSWVYETVHVPGYYETKTRYNVESRLYRTENGQRVWWALSETVNPDSVGEIISSVSAAMAKRLEDDGFLR